MLTKKLIDNINKYKLIYISKVRAKVEEATDLFTLENSDILQELFIAGTYLISIYDNKHSFNSYLFKYLPSITSREIIKKYNKSLLKLPTNWYMTDRQYRSKKKKEFNSYTRLDTENKEGELYQHPKISQDESEKDITDIENNIDYNILINKLEKLLFYNINNTIDREVFISRYIRGKTIQQICDYYNVSKQAIYSRITRVKNKIAEVLKYEQQI